MDWTRCDENATIALHTVFGPLAHLVSSADVSGSYILWTRDVRMTESSAKPLEAALQPRWETVSQTTAASIPASSYNTDVESATEASSTTSQALAPHTACTTATPQLAPWPTPEPPRVKRSRTGVACLHCRARKIRCSAIAGDSICSNCTHANVECTTIPKKRMRRVAR